MSVLNKVQFFTMYSYECGVFSDYEYKKEATDEECDLLNSNKYFLVVFEIKEMMENLCNVSRLFNRYTIEFIEEQMNEDSDFFELWVVHDFELAFKRCQRHLTRLEQQSRSSIYTDEDHEFIKNKYEDLYRAYNDFVSKYNLLRQKF